MVEIAVGVENDVYSVWSLQSYLLGTQNSLYGQGRVKNRA